MNYTCSKITQTVTLVDEEVSPVLPGKNGLLGVLYVFHTWPFKLGFCWMPLEQVERVFSCCEGNIRKSWRVRRAIYFTQSYYALPNNWSSLCNTWNFEIKMLLYWKEEKKKIAKKWFPLLCYNTSYLSKSKLKKSFSIKVHEDVMFEEKF